MVALSSLLVILSISLITVRFATVALTLTGLSEESARFQARSAFTGTGFTTNESEKVVNHPVRRRIVMTLMLVRNAGIVSAVSSLLLSFVNVDDQVEGWMRIGFLAVGVALLWMAAASRWVDRAISRLVHWAFSRFTTLNVRDYANLLHLAGDYAVSELHVHEGDWLADRELARLDLPSEGVLVLGIKRVDGRYLGAPKGSAHIHPGDTVVLYGRQKLLTKLDNRRQDHHGNFQHLEGVVDQQRAESVENDEPSDDAAA